MPLVRTACVAAFSLAAAVHAPFAAAQTPPCGTVVTQSIQLTSDLLCPNGTPALIVGADNVRIDPNGFKISGTAPLVYQNFFFSIYAPAILSRGHDGVEVVGPGRISQFLYDVWIIKGRGHLVADLHGSSALGVFLGGTSDSRVENNDLDYGAGIKDHEGPPWFTPVGPAQRNYVKGNRIGTATYRAGVVSVHGCLAQGNIVSGNAILGSIHLAGGAGFNTIERNRLHFSAQHHGSGIQVSEGYANDILEKVIEADGKVGISIEPQDSPLCSAVGQTGRNGDANFVYANTIENGSIAVRVGALPPARWTLGMDNVILGNTFTDMSIAGQHFGPETAKNDGRFNKYVNVALEVEDLGTANLWP